MSYNMSEIDNNVELGSFFQNVNTAASGYPAIVFLLVLWVGAYVYTTNRNLNPGEALTITNFLMVLVSGLFYFASLTSISIVMVFVGALFVSVGYLMFK